MQYSGHCRGLLAERHGGADRDLWAISTIWPTGAAQPVVSTMNSLDGRFKANAAIVPAGYQGAVSVYVSNTTNVILDINGYFTTPGARPCSSIR